MPGIIASERGSAMPKTDAELFEDFKSIDNRHDRTVEEFNEVRWVYKNLISQLAIYVEEFYHFACFEEEDLLRLKSGAEQILVKCQSEIDRRNQ